MRSQKSSILIVDDHPIVLKGLTELIDEQPDMVVIGSLRNATSLLASLESVVPDLVVMDLGLGHADGLELLKAIRARFDHLAILVFSMHDELDYALRAIGAGAMGYVMKDNADDQLLVGIRTVLKDGVYLSPRVKETRPQEGIKPAKMGVESLTDREISIFEMIGSGLNTKTIATNLHLSIKTVEKHRENIKRKLGIDGGAKLASEAAGWVWRRRMLSGASDSGA